MSPTPHAGRWQEALEAGLAGSLPGFLPSQRWFGAKARRIAAARVEDAVWLRDGDEPCAVVPVRVEYAGGGSERYALLVALRREPGGGPSLGVLGAGGEIRHVVEASGSPNDAACLLRHLDRAHELAGRRGGVLRFGDLPDGGGGLDPAAVEAGNVAPLGAEQSNTSLRVGDGHVFKLFRRLEAGENPEVEIGRFLGTRTSFRAVPALRGSVTWIPAGGPPGTIGSLQDRVENEGDGWRWALARLERVLTGADPPGPLADQIRALGAVTADLHVALASGPDAPGFAPVAVTPADAREWETAFRSRAERVLAMLADGLAAVPAEARAACGTLVRLSPRLESAARLPATTGDGAFAKIRIHGDYHLGQTLRTAGGFVLLDFEGEPARPLEERRRPHCALKDVSGMLRSFDYALETVRARLPGGARGEAPPLRDAFLGGYEGRALERGAPFLPAAAAARDRWRTFFELDKAVYELEYELQNRPDWVGIPARGILSLLGEEAGPGVKAAGARRGRPAGDRSKGGIMTEPRRMRAAGGSAAVTREAAARAAARADEGHGIPDEGILRVVVEDVRPSVDDGRFAVKRTVGEPLEVLADVFADGHGRLGVALRHRPPGAERWAEIAMEPLGNDVWRAALPLQRPGFHEYTVEAWLDVFGTWRDGLAKKAEAGLDVAAELMEGAGIVRAGAARTEGRERAWLLERAAALAGDAPQGPRVAAALDRALEAAMADVPDRGRSAAFDRTLRVWVDRERARYGAWYEMFPRSAGADPSRSATFREAETRLADIAAMGFDVVYLPPVHPIGRSHRKGRNNTLGAGPADPGSPWAIGAAEGGHTAIDPGLGTLEDFDRFVAAATRHGLELALDLAFQCSPDHPWVREHPGWFRHRPDGTIQYAENPPKKYQDIYPLDFECEDWRGLWGALLGVVRFWIGRGVRIFRVDNPHTKPFRFWDWLIAEVQRTHPDVLFLSEAFTRPRVMRRLAKGGFTQSYTYFTWRNRRAELEEYFTELTRSPVREYLRPNLFANTPDILHEYLQTGGRAAFQVRFVLAATLGASYGIYGPPFELCEARAVPGTEEYENSEKYEIKVWDHDRAGHLRGLIALVNRARRDHPALQFDHRLRFHPVDADELICYSKSTPDLSDVVLAVVNLDPHHAHDGWVRLSLPELGLAADQPYQVHDLLSDERYLWSGDRNYVRLDPQVAAAHLFVVRRRVRTERDFDYYL